MKELLRLVITLLIAVTLVGTIIFFLNSTEFKMKEIEKLITDDAYERLFEEFVEADILGASAKEYFDFFGLKAISTYIGVDDGRITFIPVPDALNQQTYYFDGDKLALYIATSNTVGGQYFYYFSDDKLISTKKTDGLKEIDAKPESEYDILDRAQKIYDRYMK